MGHSRYSLPTEKVEYYNVMVDGRSLFDQPIKININHIKTFEKFQLVKEMTTQPVVC